MRDPPPLFAVQRLPAGRWLIRAPGSDPFEPAVCVVDVVEPQYAGTRIQSEAAPVIRAFRSFQSKPKTTRAEINDIGWPREELLQLAYLLDRLAPPSAHDPERYFQQRSALSHELRRLARWARPSA